MFLIPKSCYGILVLSVRVCNVYTPDLELFLTVLECDLLVPCVISHGNNSMWNKSAK
jgi:hypothetical protein